MTCGAGLALLGRGGREFAFTGSSDPYWADVLLLLHGNGADGSTTFTDSSSYNRTLTIFDGTPEIDTSQSLFGGASLYGGTGNTRIRFDMSGPEWNSTNWTWECFYRRLGGSYHGMLFMRDDRLRIYVNSSAPFQLSLLGSATLFANTTSSTVIGTWAHLAVSVENVAGTRTARLFFDGVLQDTYTRTNSEIDLEAWPTPGEIGNTHSLGFAGLWGNLEEYRITAACRYTADFTVPAEAYPDYDEPVVTPPPTTVPPDGLADPYWTSVLFLSAMDLTKVNDKTGVAYTLDSASVTATDPFDGAGALACVYPPSAPTSTPFEPPELAGVTLRGSSGGCVEFWLRPDAWEPWASGAFRWANLAQQDSSAGDPLWALGIADERQSDGSVAPCLQLFSHYLDGSTYLETWRRTQAALLLPFDGLWHHIALDFRYYGGFAQTLVLYLDGVELIALTAPSYTAGETIQFGGQTVFAPVEGVSPYTTPASITSSTFDGALDEIRVTASSRYSGSFVVPHYAFPRS